MDCWYRQKRKNPNLQAGTVIAPDDVDLSLRGSTPHHITP